jgi:hypothetical protein
MTDAPAATQQSLPNPTLRPTTAPSAIRAIANDRFPPHDFPRLDHGFRRRSWPSMNDAACMGRTGGQDPEGREAWRFAVEQPTKFDLAINIKTAKVLGLTIPPTQFVRTDEG